MRQGANISRKLKITRVDGRIIKDDTIFSETYIIRGWQEPSNAEQFIRSRYHIDFIADLCTYGEQTYAMDIQTFIEKAESIDGVTRDQITLEI